MHKGLAGMLTGLKDIADNKNDADYAKASGLRYQVGSFVESNSSRQLNCCLKFSNLSISTKNNSSQGTDALLAMWQITMLRQGLVEAMAADVQNCPALLLFINQIKTCKVSS
jgi:hypothetical protein